MTKPIDDKDLPEPLRQKQPEAPAQEVIPVPAGRTLNPFEGERKAVTQSSSGAVEVQRAVAEVQAAIMLAKQFPRNKIESADRILVECTRPSLAESAIYSYPRGGQEVTGPSIRLAEVLAMNWGNFQFGWDEVARKEGQSELIAWAWDCETNVRRTTKFFVKHWRDTKKGGYPIKDERDIYELCANQAARRMRACILNIIPGDVVEAAVDQCERTLVSKEAVTADSIKAMIKAFEGFGVSKEQIEKRLGRKMQVESLNGAVMAQLRKIYTGLRDGMSKPEEFFEPDPGAGRNADDSDGAEGQGKVAGGGTGGSNPPTGADDWEAAVDEMIPALHGAKDLPGLDLVMQEFGDKIKALNESGARGAISKWSNAYAKRRGELTAPKK